MTPKCRRWRAVPQIRAWFSAFTQPAAVRAGTLNFCEEFFPLLHARVCTLYPQLVLSQIRYGNYTLAFVAETVTAPHLQREGVLSLGTLPHRSFVHVYDRRGAL